MSTIDVAGLRKAVDDAITQWSIGASPDGPSPSNEITEVKDVRVLPEGQRAVRTKNSGDKVYILDDIKKTRAWVNSTDPKVSGPDLLKSLGFEMSDVVEVPDSEMMSYNMAAPIYKAPNA